MQKWLIACISIMLCVPFRMSAQDSYADKVNRYIQQYSKLAVSEQKRSGVPAAVTLGQGILETQAGCSELVTGANNHFGIKCKSGWTGETFSHTDDAPDECFRKYKCCEDSYKDHSNYLKNTPRYASLFRLSPTDYAGWAYGLKKCGYATNPRYAQQLIKIIEDFHLQAYTYAAMGNSDMPDANDDQAADKAGSVSTGNANATLASATLATTVTTVTPVISKKKTSREVVNVYEGAPAKGQLLKVNGLRGFYALKGEMLLQYALKFNVRYEHLLEINDLKDAPLPASMFVYLERKNYKGVRPTHVVKPGENLLMISQAEGIQLRRLMTLNKLTIYGEEPVPGTVLNLQEPIERKPQVAFVYPPKEPLPTPRHRDIYAQNTTPAATPTVAAAPVSVTSTPVAVEAPAAETPAKIDDYISKPATEETTTTTTQESPVQATPEVKEEVAAAPAETTTQTSTNVNGEAPAAVVQNETAPVQTTSDVKEENTTAAMPAETAPAAPVANTEVTAPTTAPTIGNKITTQAAETPKPTELGEKPLLKDDGQETAATATAEKVQPASEAAKEVQPVEVQAPAATAEPVTTVNTVPTTIQLTEETKLDVAAAPVTKELATETVAAEQTITKPEQTVVDEAKPVATEMAKPEETPASAPAEASKPSEVIAASEPAKTPQPVHIDVQNNPAASKPVDAPAVASVSTPAAAVEEADAKPAATSAEPQDDFSRLKARLDKVVYAKNDKPAVNATATTAATTTSVVASKDTPTPVETVKVNADDAGKYYTVRKGDTAFNIAKRHNITMRQLLNWNNLDFETVKIGQRLRVKE
ncbi:MAG: glucosaminidase domain-containing protein [Flavipsychrobacter sp.]